jgi:hypothetical protein
MTASYVALDARLRDCRSVRQRCAGSLRSALRELTGLSAASAPADRQEALQIERQAAEAALEALLTPAVVPAPLMDAIEREQWHAVQASLREESLPAVRERNRSVLPRVKVAEPEPTPEPGPPAPAAPAAPPLTGWRLSRAIRLGLVTA